MKLKTVGVIVAVGGVVSAGLSYLYCPAKDISVPVSVLIVIAGVAIWVVGKLSE